MNLAQLSDIQLEKFKEQRVLDLANRSTVGTFIYLFIWISLCGSMIAKDNSETLMSWITNISGVIFLISVLRALCISLAKRNHYGSRTRIQILIFGSFFSALTWGIVSALSYLDTPLNPHANLLLIATVGICAGGSMTLSASRLVLNLFLIAMLCPILFVQIILLEETNLEVITVVFLFLFGLIFSSKQVNNEYIRSLAQTIILDDLSTQDQLTKLKNRRHLDATLNSSFEALFDSQSLQQLSIILLDIDHFKQLNDKYGHIAGDQSLIAMGKILHDNVHNSTDIVARFGGEEFAILLPNTPKSACQDIAERIRKATENNVVLYQNESIRFTVSLGCKTIESSNAGVTIQSFIEAADTALYKAKENGRNRVEISA